MKKIIALVVLILTGIMPVYSAQIGYGGGFGYGGYGYGMPVPYQRNGYMGGHPAQYGNQYRHGRVTTSDYVTRTGTVAPVKTINCLGSSSYTYIGGVPMACNSASARHVTSTKVKYKTGNKISNNKVRKVSL